MIKKEISKQSVNEKDSIIPQLTESCDMQTAEYIQGGMGKNGMCYVNMKKEIQKCGLKIQQKNKHTKKKLTSEAFQKKNQCFRCSSVQETPATEADVKLYKKEWLCIKLQ